MSSVSASLSSESCTVFPMSFSENAPASARHSPSVSGIRPATSSGTETFSVTNMNRYGSSVFPTAAIASTPYAPSAYFTPSSCAKAARSLSVRPRLDMSWKSNMRLSRIYSSTVLCMAG